MSLRPLLSSPMRRLVTTPKKYPTFTSPSGFSYHIRPARQQDAARIHEIFTHYVLNSAVTLDLAPPNLKFHEEVIAAGTMDALPVLVAAIARGSTVTGKTSLERMKHTPNADASDNVEGSDKAGDNAGLEEAEGEDVVIGYRATRFLFPGRLGWNRTVTGLTYIDSDYLHRGIGSRLISEVVRMLQERASLTHPSADTPPSASSPPAMAELLYHAPHTPIPRQQGEHAVDTMLTWNTVFPEHVDDVEKKFLTKMGWANDERWYRRQGYEMVGRVRSVGWKFGRDWDVVWWQRNVKLVEGEGR